MFSRNSKRKTLTHYKYFRNLNKTVINCSNIYHFTDLSNYSGRYILMLPLLLPGRHRKRDDGANLEMHSFTDITFSPEMLV